MRQCVCSDRVQYLWYYSLSWVHVTDLAGSPHQPLTRLQQTHLPLVQLSKCLLCI